MTSSCLSLPGWLNRVALVGSLVLTAAAALPISTGLAQSTPIASPAVSGAIDVTGRVLRPGPLSVADLQALPSETVDVAFESGGKAQDHTFTGVRLIDVLAYLGLDVDADAHHPLLPMYLVVTANDGYQVVISGGEIDPDFGNVPMLLAWDEDGVPLAGDQGPLRLVVPGDKHGGRNVFGVVTIDVRTVAGG